MIKGVYNFLVSLRIRNKRKADRLYYLTGIKPIQANKYALNECTVGRE
jgi:hypothetical protein